MVYSYRELDSLLQALHKLGDLSGTDFAVYYAEAKYELVKLFDSLYSHLKTLRETESFKEYAVEEEAVARKYVKYGDDGKALEPSKEEFEAIQKELEVLRTDEKYKDITKQYQDELAAVEKIYKEDTVEVNLKKIPVSKLPKEITAEQAFSIRQLIDGYVDQNDTLNDAINEQLEAAREEVKKEEFENLEWEPVPDGDPLGTQVDINE
jgi:hypothetical protein